MDLIKKINLDKIRNAAEDVINQAKPKTEVETRIYEALSHKNWGSSSTLMNEISRDSFNYESYTTITKIMWESLQNQRPAAWRVVFKALTLLEHLVKNGSERCVDDARNHSHILRALFNFNYYEGTTDRGIGVREKSKLIVELIGDDERVREERTKAAQLREKFGGNLGGVSSSGGGSGYGKSSYSGYGNDDYGGYNGGNNGYGDSGIGSSSGYGGRYNDKESTTVESTNPDANDVEYPTFAAVSEKKKKKTKKSKKKKEKVQLQENNVEGTFHAKTPEIDLLAMDDPPQLEPNLSGFDAFQSAPSETPQVNNFDAFGTSMVPTENSFDAFGTSTTANLHSKPRFDAFHSSAPMLGQVTQPFDAFGVNSSTKSNINDAFGTMSLINMQAPNSTDFTTPDVRVNGQNVTKEEEDFGDFTDGNSKKTQSSDVISNLISLDGLTKNSKKEEKKIEPIGFKPFVHQSNAKMSVNNAFSSFDGLNSVNNHNVSQIPFMSDNQKNASVANGQMATSFNNNNMNMNMANSQTHIGHGGMNSQLQSSSSNIMGGMNTQQISHSFNMQTNQINLMGGGTGEQSGSSKRNIMGGKPMGGF